VILDTMVKWKASPRTYFCARIHSTIVLRSASGTLFGGIGIWPQTPLPPLLTFCSSFAGAPASPAYLAAISFQEGPTSFLSRVWQAWQLYLVRSGVASAGAAPAVDETPSQAKAVPQSASFRVHALSIVGLLRR